MFLLLTCFPIDLKFWYFGLWSYLQEKNLKKKNLPKKGEKCYLLSCNLFCIVYKTLVVNFSKIFFLFSSMLGRDFSKENIGIFFAYFLLLSNSEKQIYTGRRRASSLLVQIQALNLTK